MHAEDQEWLDALRATGPRNTDAVRRLHELMVRGARHQVARMRATTPELVGTIAEDVVEYAASEAVVAVLGKLDSFEGRSRFSTWAFKFAIFHAGAQARRTVWRGREVSMDLLPERPASDTSPSQALEAADLKSAIDAALNSELTDHQRIVAVALLIDDIPIDVLAQRLETNRNALYKTLHDARSRLRKALIAQGYLSAIDGKTVVAADTNKHQRVTEVIA